MVHRLWHVFDSACLTGDDVNDREQFKREGYMMCYLEVIRRNEVSEGDISEAESAIKVDL